MARKRKGFGWAPKIKNPKDSKTSEAQQQQLKMAYEKHHDKMAAGMFSMLTSEEMANVTIAVEGKQLKAHQMVLSICSPYFKSLLLTNPCTHPVIFMKDVKYCIMKDLLRFMYEGEAKIKNSDVTNFIATARALEIKWLTEFDDATNEDSMNVRQPPQRPKRTAVKRPFRSCRPAKTITTTDPATEEPSDLQAAKKSKVQAENNDTEEELIANPAPTSESLNEQNNTSEAPTVSLPDSLPKSADAQDPATSSTDPDPDVGVSVKMEPQVINLQDDDIELLDVMPKAADVHVLATSHSDLVKMKKDVTKTFKHNDIELLDSLHQSANVNEEDVDSYSDLDDGLSVKMEEDDHDDDYELLDQPDLSFQEQGTPPVLQNDKNNDLLPELPEPSEDSDKVTLSADTVKERLDQPTAGTLKQSLKEVPSEQSDTSQREPTTKTVPKVTLYADAVKERLENPSASTNKQSLKGLPVTVKFLKDKQGQYMQVNKQRYKKDFTANYWTSWSCAFSKACYAYAVLTSDKCIILKNVHYHPLPKQDTKGLEDVKQDIYYLNTSTNLP